MNLPKNDNNNRTHKNNTKNLSCHMINASFWTSTSYNTSNSSHLFWNLENPVLVQTLSYRRKTTNHLLLIIGFSHKLISIQDVGRMLHLNKCSSIAAITVTV